MPRRLLPLACILASGCLIGSVDPVPVEVRSVNARPVLTPARVHLLHGESVILGAPWYIRDDSLVGGGERFDIRLASRGSFHGIPLDSVVGVEAWTRQVDAGASTLVSTLLLAGTFFMAYSVGEAVFGSCPTIYSDSLGHDRLEGESFSYAIAPLLEVRDVDRLVATPGADGILRLTIRNEAAETHHINHLEVIAVAHAADEFVAPGTDGLPLALRHEVPLRITDRLGVDHTDHLARADALGYETDPALIAGATLSDVHDSLFIELPATDGTTAGLVLRARNSLLTTVLLYDLMMARQGPAALEWLSTDLGDLSTMLSVGQWYVAEFGLQVAVETPAGWQPIARLPDPGPIAFETVALVIPVTPGRPTRVRLTFPLDAWRLDQVRGFTSARTAEARRVPLSAARAPDGQAMPELLARLVAPDDRYLETTPGTWFTAEFADAGIVGPATWFVAAQGWYSEWMRPDWLLTPEPVAFEPGRARVLEAIQQWEETRDELEVQFAASRFVAR